MGMPGWIDYDVGCGRTRRWCWTLDECVAELCDMMQDDQLAILACGYQCVPSPLAPGAATSVCPAEREG
jgi:hypothetical protein